MAVTNGRRERMDSTGNIFWSEIPKGTKIYNHGSSWSVVIKRKRFVVFWTGEEAGKAQRFLNANSVPFHQI